MNYAFYSQHFHIRWPRRSKCDFVFKCFSSNKTNKCNFFKKNLVDGEEQNYTTTSTSIFEIFKLKTARRSGFLSHFCRHHQTQNISSYSRLNASRTNSALTIDNQNYVKSQLPYDSIQMQYLDVGSLLERRDYKRLQYDSTAEGTPSFAGSSLDLQWEHEYDDVDQPYPPYSWHNSQDDSSSSESEENGCSIEMSQITSSSNAKLNQQNNNYNNNQPVMVSNRKTNRMRLQNRNRCSSASHADSETKIKSNTSRSHISTPESLEWDAHDDDPKFRSDDDLIDRETMELLDEIEWLKNRALVETGDTQWKPEQQGNS